MLAVREYCELMEVFGQPWRGFGDVDKAVFDYRGLRMHTHRLLVGRLVAGDAMAALGDQILDQLRARSLVLDQHDAGVEQVLLRAHRAFEGRIFEAPAE